MKINNLLSIRQVVDLILGTEEQQGSEVGSSNKDPVKVLRPSSWLEALQAELARLKPDLTRESIASLISEKKSKVGGGFLTDQGALFLVASDLGVTLKPMLFDKSRISELPPETNDSMIDARILAFGPPKLLQKRGDSSLAFVMKMIVYNLSSTISTSMWNYSIASSFIKSNFGPGEAVRIRGGYSRKPAESSELTLSISESGEIMKSDEKNALISEIPSLSERTIDLARLKTVPLGTSIVISARLSSAVRIGQFKRKDGIDTRYISFSLSAKDQNGQERNSETRVVIWDNMNPVFENLRMGEIITLLNVRPKMTEFLGSKNLELHGDETSGILEHWNETKVWIEGRFGLVAEQIQKSASLPFEDSKTQGTSAFIARILSIERANEEKTPPIHLLLIDSSKRQIAVTAQDEALENFSTLKMDDVIVCKPDSFDQTGSKAVCKRKGSLTKVKPERNDIPRSTMLASEIAKLQPSSIASIDCMVLSITPSRDIATKEGLVKRSEALLADPSGEVKIYAWRTLSKHLDKLSAGDRIWVHACEVQSHEGKKFVVIKNYSRIETQN
jgi:hypothetical protein